MNKARHFLRGTAVVVCSLALLTGCNRREEAPAGANAPGATGPGMGSTGPGAAPGTAPGSTTAPDGTIPGMSSAPASAASGTGMSGSTPGVTPSGAASGAGR